jgi:spore germination cell wall hydrolase CwlJ-like protein
MENALPPSDDQQIKQIADIIYGEAADQKPEVMKMVGSTIINRMTSGRATEFGVVPEEIGKKGYYAVINQNEPFKQAVSGKFKDGVAEEAYKKVYAIASGLYKGTIPLQKGQFFFKPDEESKLRKNPKKFNFKEVKNEGQVGDYNVYGY